MNMLFAGGSKSGKSALAQEAAVRLAAGGPLYYLATMIPADEEDRDRIEKHIAHRAGMGFTTLEQGRNICTCLDRADPEGTFLLDSVTALLTNEMYPADQGYAWNRQAGAACREDLLAFARQARNVVFVLDNLADDSLTYDLETEAFRRELGAIGCALAEICHTVVEVTAGIPICCKGGQGL